MPKKKGKKKGNSGVKDELPPEKEASIINYRIDFTINDSANALKPVSRIKKSVNKESAPAQSWEDIQDKEVDNIIEEVNADGTKVFVYKKNGIHSKSVEDSVQEQPGLVYPEIVWYLLSPYIKPEDVGNFAGINQATYFITKRESFWRALYKRYCKNHRKLPDKLRIENNYKLYGLRQRVIRALYHTYNVFTQKVLKQSAQDSRPHGLVKRRCVNVWYCKGATYWYVYFKLKASKPERVKCSDNFIEELGRIDANPEEDSQVLQVTCQSFHEVPPLMGMTLTSVSVVLSRGFRHHRLHLGFNTGHFVSRYIVPECSVVIETVINMSVYDWWHPKYPYFENRLPSNMQDEESLPVLKRDFFASDNADL